MSIHPPFPSALPVTAWKAAFAASLVRLVPDLNPDAADEASDQALKRHGTLAPESAALAWVANFDQRAVLL